MMEPRIADHMDYLNALGDDGLKKYLSDLNENELQEELNYFKKELEKHVLMSKKIGFAILKVIVSKYPQSTSTTDNLITNYVLQKLETERYRSVSGDI